MEENDCEIHWTSYQKSYKQVERRVEYLLFFSKHQTKTISLVKLSFKNERKIKTFPNKIEEIHYQQMCPTRNFKRSSKGEIK